MSYMIPEPPVADPFLPLLETLVDRLADDLDHPEVWALLAKTVGAEDFALLRATIAAVLPFQGGPVGKALEIVDALLDALAGDSSKGVGRLDRLAIAHPHCPQVAGALFFVHRAGDPARSADLADRFCEAPFVKFETLADGQVAPCCSIWTRHRLGNLERDTFDDIWNGAAAQDMRASILDGSYRHCNKQRCTLIMDDVLPRRADIVDPVLRTVIDEGRTHMPQNPRWLFLAHDVTCNLACPSCRDGIAAADEAQEARFAIVERQVFRPLLDAGGDVTVSVSGQGDPWSSPHYRAILRYMADHDLRAGLNIHTNALLMSEARWAQYAGLEKYRPLVDVSIDACSPWVYHVVRRPGRWERLLPNLRFIAGGRAAHMFSAFHLNATIQLDNFHEIGGLVDLAEGLGADSMRLYMIQNTGGHLAGLYERLNVADVAHPLHLAFLATLRDPRLERPVAVPYDVATWRARSLARELPADALGIAFTRHDLFAAIAASDDHRVIVALCAAGRIRFPGDPAILMAEAQALHALGFPVQAGYRLKEREAVGGEAVSLG